mmetsp:Transcript_22768/g.41081  ORF Transcript_22768/g.41081 Transcript_22768/m.41081 type:complete len:170 (-) Transcript_22768:86-595(-)|eukprot:CAMPEP_0196141746 /NCGR_PEP_ID=MMETSP0910-20130528/10403_1 /TAXON_ID=49265 /ORGANISM="Thalassiosira rotula, Strain GSO102" /LENGTH=169 /DNA_ID=CAMNT_0041402951 /DNA_START=48 /DNA_END=557 /DNA_ORIENTATION=+
MVYPKHQALSSTPPRKKVKTLTMSNNNFKTTATTTTDAASDDEPYQENSFTVIYEMFSNYNTMLATNMLAIKKMKEKNAKDTALLNGKLGDILRRVRSLDRRLGDLEVETKANTENNVKSSRAVGALFHNAYILESRVSSVERCVSSINRLILRSKKRKRARADKKASV